MMLVAVNTYTNTNTNALNNANSQPYTYNYAYTRTYHTQYTYIMHIHVHILTRSYIFFLFSSRLQVCSVTSPFFLSHATNALYDGDLTTTMKYVALYAILAFAAKALKEAQSLVYLK